jgi:hypothetical protein
MYNKAKQEGDTLGRMSAFDEARTFWDAHAIQWV